MIDGPVLVFGAGHLGRQVLHHLRHQSQARVLGFIDDTRPVGAVAPGGHVCVGPLEEVARKPGLGPDEVAVVFAIGYSDMLGRGRALQRVLAAGYRLRSVIHSRAVIEPGAVVGEGCIILANAIVDQNVNIGRGCFLDCAVRIGEDSVVGDNNYLSSGAALGGSVRLGSGSFLGMDTTVVTGVSVGSNCFIVAKALVARSLADNTKLVQLHKAKEMPLPDGGGVE